MTEVGLPRIAEPEAGRCRDCAAVLTVDTVWEPGTCRDCARRLTAGALDKYYPPLGHYG